MVGLTQRQSRGYQNTTLTIKSVTPIMMKHNPVFLSFLLCAFAMAVQAYPVYTGTNNTPATNTVPQYQSYPSTIYAPFTDQLPSDICMNGTIDTENESSTGSGPRRLHGGYDPGTRSDKSPIGAPWILLLFATTFAACTYIKHHRNTSAH